MNLASLGLKELEGHKAQLGPFSSYRGDFYPKRGLTLAIGLLGAQCPQCYKVTRSSSLQLTKLYWRNIVSKV